MRTFRVNVNGNTYEVQLEEISASEIKNTSASAQKTSAPQSAQGRAVNAPIAGTVLSVNVSSGQSVKAGDVLLIIEAMKMENEICAPCDGKISAVAVSKGATVASGELLCTIG